MSITAKTRKILWARSGNRCAFPGCGQKLVEKTESLGPDIVVGEEAHIAPRSRNGPRGCEFNHVEDTDSYSNIILLCPTHHRFVDAAPKMFTKECLVAMKSEHEGRVRADRRSTERLRRGGVLVRGIFGQATHVWQIGDSIVVVDSYGSSPIQLDHGHWRAAGVRIGQSHAATEDVHWLFDSSEAEPDIEYWSSASKLYVVQEANLFDENRFAPFIRHEFDLAKVPASSKVYLLLDADPSLVAGIPALVKEIWSIDHNDCNNRLEILLLRMWKAGLTDPDRVCEELLKFKSAKWHDGGMAELVTSMMRELSLVQRARVNN